jgi:frataxin-like iron-binding protein CyaY
MTNNVEAGILTLDQIESRLSECALEVDRNGEDSLQITFESNVYLLNVHRTLGELWLSSAKSGAHHFNHKEGEWQTARGLTLKSVLNEELGAVLGCKILD